jgi:hypothetical protein
MVETLGNLRRLFGRLGKIRLDFGPKFAWLGCFDIVRCPHVVMNGWYFDHKIGKLHEQGGSVMAAVNFLLRSSSKAGLLALALSVMHDIAWGAQVAFDLPSAVECRDVTPKEFAEVHPTLKVVEAKFRISARMIEGTPSGIVEFFYVLKTDQAMRITEYLPNTTLESSVAEDHIEVTDATENSKATGLDAHVAYKPLLLGGSHNQSLKKSESSHYKQIAAKDLVLASGTIDREHGVFFRLRPSRSDSLEGGKEFMFMATVPKTWRGSLCTISCSARATKHSMISTSVVPSGSEEVQVGLYVAGDVQAAALAEDLRLAQEALENLLMKQPKKSYIIHTISTEAAGLLTGKAARQRQELANAKKAVSELQKRIEQLGK